MGFSMVKQKISMKEIVIGELFDFPETNSKITKDFCNRNKGTIPVYASSRNEDSVLGYIPDNLKGVKYYVNCLSWNRNGSVGYVFIRNHKFATNEDHRAMIIKQKYENKLDKLYLKFEIERKLLFNGFSFLNKCGVAKIKSVFIEIPINENGDFDKKKQIELSSKYEKLKDLKVNLESMSDEISNVKVDFSEKIKSKEFFIKDLFEIKKGNAKYTRRYILNNSGKFPLYSSKTVNEGVIGLIDSFDYDGMYLTWTTDGIHAGTVFYRNNKFSMTTHCGALFLKENFKDKINLRYIHYLLLLYLKDYATGEENKRVTVNIIEDIPVKIPVDSKDNLDIEKQKEISSKYEQLEKIKSHISEDFENIINPSISVI